jgi:hypothetical protein
MTREQAMTTLRRVLGKQGRYRVGRRLSSPERREAARQRVAELEERMRPLKEQLRALAHEQSRFEQEARYFKFWVGTTDHGLFTMERAKGDTWEEVLAGLHDQGASEARGA